MTPTAAARSFEAALTRPMRRAGLEGKPVTVSLDGSVLRLRGARAGDIALPAAAIARMRVGYVETKHGKVYETLLWREGDGLRLHLHPLADKAGYAALVRALARAMAGCAGLRRIERGTSWTNALLLPVAIGLLAIVACAISIFLLEGEPFWGRVAVPLVPVLLEAYLIWALVARHAPRPVTDLAELDDHLPGAEWR